MPSLMRFILEAALARAAATWSADERLLACTIDVCLPRRFPPSSPGTASPPLSTTVGPGDVGGASWPTSDLSSAVVPSTVAAVVVVVVVVGWWNISSSSVPDSNSALWMELGVSSRSVLAPRREEEAEGSVVGVVGVVAT